MAETPDGILRALADPERLAIEFDPRVRNSELEVNAIVGRFHPDHAAVRRSLVDEGFLTREHGVYWRTGGRVDL